MTVHVRLLAILQIVYASFGLLLGLGVVGTGLGISGLWVLLHGKKTRIYLPGLRDLSGYHAMWADFVSAWKADRKPAMTLEQARRDLELVEQAYATAGVS